MTRNKRDVDFLRLKFQEYYIRSHGSVVAPNRTHMREFAIEGWDTGDFSTYWTRHIGFRSPESLINELKALAPPSVYHSAAFYKYPVARDMNEKRWQGAELVFDIDADHIDAPCAKDHDVWRCNNPDCGMVGTGRPPEDEGCPRCSGTSFSTRKWICEKCLGLAKENTLKIYDMFLTRDFGIDPESITLNYSGHRGFHIRVESSDVFPLDAEARTEIAHYITGFGMSGERLEFSVGQVNEAISRDAPGWAGKIADALIAFIRRIDSYSGQERWVKPLRDAKIAAIEALMKNPPMISARVKSVGLKSWQEIATQAVLEYGGEIDIPVTHDVHRVIRLVGSINGKTGFRVSPLTREEMDDFDPFVDAITFSKGSMRIHVRGSPVSVPAIKIADETFGPFDDEIVDLPLGAAIFLLCKGVATLE